MATITQAMKKIGFSLNKPLVKILEGGEKVPLQGSEIRRLPPGQFATERFATLHHESRFPTQEEVKNWRLVVDGEVEKPLDLSLDDLKRLQNANVTADFHCVTSWTRFDNKWTGVRIKDLLKLARVKPSGKFVTQTAFSGHTTSTPITDVVDDDVLVAWMKEDLPLEPEHGAPIRVVLPRKYAYKGVKWLTRLTVTKDEELGYWEVRGYSQTADPWKNDRYS